MLRIEYSYLKKKKSVLGYFKPVILANDYVSLS